MNQMFYNTSSIDFDDICIKEISAIDLFNSVYILIVMSFFYNV
jgi:hypothetical protein